MNYEDMSDFDISKEVAFAIRGRDEVCVIDTSLGKLVRIFNGNPKNEDYSGWVDFDPCNNPSDAWPVIFENKIATEWFTSDLWRAQCDNQFQPGEFKVWTSYCYKPLRAAMICFLKMKDAEK